MIARPVRSFRHGAVALVIALAMLGAACSDDAEPGAESVDSSGEPAEADATTGDDTEVVESGSEAESGGASEVVATGDLDCTELQDALQTIGDSLEFDPSLAGEPAQLEASFATVQQQLDALAASAPEIAEPVTAVKAGLGDLGAAFAEIGWDASTLASDPGLAASFTAEATPIVTELFVPLNTVQSYVGTNCI